MRSNCIYTGFVCKNLVSKMYSKIHVQNLKRYCKKYELDFLIIENEIQKYKIHVSEGYKFYEHAYLRFYMSQLLEKYQRVLNVDFDMLFLNNCENVFQLVPEDKIGYVPMMNISVNTQLQYDQINISVYNEIYNTHFNSLNASGGFHLFPKKYKQKLSIQNLKIDNMQGDNLNLMLDTYYMNYLVSSFKDNAFKLPIQYNFLYPHERYRSTNKIIKLRQYAETGNVKIIHFPGLSPKNLISTRWKHMLYFDEKFGVK